MGIKKLTEKTSTAVLAGTGIITLVAGLATTAMVLISLPAEAPAAAPAGPGTAETVTADWTRTPASTVLTESLNSPPAGWTGEGPLRQLVTAPMPYSCPQPGTAPSVSLARTFTAGGTRFQVVTQAYTAGIGAEAADRQRANAWVCAGPETALYSEGLDSPGRDTRLATTYRGGVRAAVLSFRRGDVITYVTGSPSAPLRELATVFHQSLTGRLDGVCSNQDSTFADASRSPWSAAGYRAHTVTERVAIPDVGLPTRPEPTPLPTPTGPATPSPKPSPWPAQVPIPAPDLVTATAEPMEQPEYPVAPAMPAPVPEPSLPAAPAAHPDLETELQVSANDTTGPGCGWAFTGMKPLVFDAAAAEKDAAARTAKAKASLEAGAKAWQGSVLKYWTEYARYRTAAEAYNKYAAKVETVNAAWAEIGEDWDRYNEAVKDRAAKVAEREQFIARQNAAKKEYEAKQKTCTAAAATPSPSPSATPAPEPTASASPRPTATATPTTPPGCPAERPAILDEAPQAVPDAPVKPKAPAGSGD